MFCHDIVPRGEIQGPVALNNAMLTIKTISDSHPAINNAPDRRTADFLNFPRSRRDRARSLAVEAGPGTV